jgi:hypothetical protein
LKLQPLSKPLSRTSLPRDRVVHQIRTGRTTAVFILPLSCSRGRQPHMCANRKCTKSRLPNSPYCDTRCSDTGIPKCDGRDRDCAFSTRRNLFDKHCSIECAWKTI